jgi:hypothetical protein
MMDLVFKEAMNQKTIVLIGAGELGSRHLQGLAKCDFAVKIEVLDPNEKSLAISKIRMAETRPNLNIQEVEYFQEMGGLASEIDLAIVSTSSNVRLSVLKELLQTKKVQNVLLEKVLFQSVGELDEAASLFEKTGAKVYVNCPKRGFESSKTIFENIRSSKNISYRVDGENWGLCCNAIHFIDTMAFYTGETFYRLDTSGLDKEILESKRSGFVEFSGKLVADFGHGRLLTLVSKKGPGISFETTIETDQKVIYLDEKQGRLKIVSKMDQKQEVIGCRTPFQSELTGDCVKKIIFKDFVGLPDYQTSARLHRPLIEGLLEFYNESLKKTESRLPIT